MVDAVLLGGNLANLVAALELSKRGRRVVLCLDGKSVGGHFSGIERGGYSFDIGMIFFEFMSACEQSYDPESYRSEVRNDVARFARMTCDYVSNYLELRSVRTPVVWLSGSWHRDIIISNCLDVLPSVGVSDSEIACLQSIARLHGWHASRKFSSACYDHLSYENASRFNHGNSLHEALFEPFCRKVMGVPSSVLLARYHRLAWLPLYYPETLSAALKGQEINLPFYDFSTSTVGFSGSLIKSIFEDIKRSSVVVEVGGVSGISNVGGRFEVVLNGKAYCSGHLALGVSPSRACEIIGGGLNFSADCTSLCVVFGLLPRDKVRLFESCLMVPDELFSIYRITNQDYSSGLMSDYCRISIELSSTLFVKKYGVECSVANRAFVLGELCALGFIFEAVDFVLLDVIHANNSLLVPTGNTSSAVSELAELLSGKGYELTGGLLGLGCASINDQIVQGLQLASKWGGYDK